MSDDVRFTGRVRLRASTQAEVLGRVDGVYRWVEPDQPGARIEGSFVVDRGERKGYFNPFGTFDVMELRGRAVILEIPGLGWSPVRLYGAREPEGSDPRRWTLCRDATVEFRAWAAPVPILRPAEIASILWTAAHDALQEAGHEELARICRTGAAALAGFPLPAPKPEEPNPTPPFFAMAEDVREGDHE